MLHRARVRLRCIGFLVALVLSGCVSAATTVMPNPLVHGGIVAVNMIPQADLDRSAYYALGNEVFTNEASIISLDPHNLCFAVTLRVEANAPDLTRLQGWRVYVRTERTEIRQPVFGQTVIVGSQPYAGSVQRQDYPGAFGGCGRFGCSGSRYMLVRDPMMVNVVTSNGSVCFAHERRVGESTRELTLHLDAPGDLTRRLAFRWRLEP